MKVAYLWHIETTQNLIAAMICYFQLMRTTLLSRLFWLRHRNKWYLVSTVCRLAFDEDDTIFAFSLSKKAPTGWWTNSHEQKEFFLIFITTSIWNVCVIPISFGYLCFVSKYIHQFTFMSPYVHETQRDRDWKVIRAYQTCAESSCLPVVCYHAVLKIWMLKSIAFLPFHRFNSLLTFF